MSGRFVLGFFIKPGEWYSGLAKPAIKPPGWVFGPVWMVLYVLIAIAGWRVWQRDRRSWPMPFLMGADRPEFAWTPVFVGAHALGLVLIVIVVMLAAILCFIATGGNATAWRHGCSRPTPSGSLLPLCCGHRN